MEGEGRSEGQGHGESQGKRAGETDRGEKLGKKWVQGWERDSVVRNSAT